MKHHYAPWTTDQKDLGGFARVTLQEGDAHSHCTRCKVSVKIGRVGGTKFWVNGRWTGKRPPCTGTP